MIQQITLKEAEKLIGDKLPDGMNWYQLSGLQFYPRYGDWSQTWIEADGLSAIIGMAKRATPEPERELEGEAMG